MLGIDLVDINKFRMKCKNPKFIYKIFTDNEIHYGNKKGNRIETFAGLFAAKEAVIKALNLNLAYILRKKIEILHINNKPYAVVDNKIELEISISHQSDYAVAVCNNKSLFNEIIIDKNIKKLLVDRNENSHKGDFGRVAILGGSNGMSGSVYLSSLASLRSGCGLSHIICPSSISNILQIKSTESIIEEVKCDNFHYSDEIYNKILIYLKNKDSLAIGPGMGRANGLNKLLFSVIKEYKKNIVIDADGLNALSDDISILKNHENIILTPHVMEFHRLSKLPLEYINKNRMEVAKKFAKENKIILVLKGHKTIVTDGDYSYINNTGNSGMATAGSGDVLTGIILANLSIMKPLNAAILSVYIHGLAGDIAKIKLGADSMIASDIVNNISEAYKLMRK